MIGEEERLKIVQECTRMQKIGYDALIRISCCFLSETMAFMSEASGSRSVVTLLYCINAGF